MLELILIAAAGALLWWGDKLDKTGRLPGGDGAHLSPNQVDQRELRMGIRHEQEHVSRSGLSRAERRSIAQEIALDHLAKHPDYYTRLEQAEKKMKRRR